MLLMKKRFFDDIRAGSKTSTLRYWRWPHVRAGSAHTVPGLGRIRVRSVRPICLDELTDDDARADGFESLEAMHAALAKFYPADKRRGRRLYKIDFAFPAEA